MKRSFLVLKKTFSLVLSVFVVINIVLDHNISSVKASSGAVRGVAGDLWADIELGKRSFDEIMPSGDAYHGKGGGAVVDRRTSPGKAYIWDGFYSRILGYDLGDCYALDNSQKCTPDLLIGQPSYDDYGSCNQDASFQYYPDKSPASASTLCSVPEHTHTTLEDKSYTGMYVDQSTGNLFVYDTLNNRVLEYYDPYATDTVADQVWGQVDFTGSKCNLTKNWNDPVPNPTASSLCFLGDYTQGAGVTLDHLGNLWVADGGNGRVLRFPNVDGVISKTADIVLGQSSFTTKNIGEEMNRLWSPSSVQEGADGSIYVLTSSSSFIRRFDAPFTTGMNASAVILTTDDLPNGSAYLSMDSTGDYFWTGTYNGFGDTYQKWSLDGTYQNVSFDNWLAGSGSIGFDTLGNLLVPTSDITVYNYNSGTNTYTEGRYFFKGWEGGPTPRLDRLGQGGWGGMTVTSTGQLIAIDGRLLYWNDAINKTDGQSADGWVGTAHQEDSGSFGILTIDKDDKVYVQRNGKSIEIYQAPLTNSSTPIKTLSAPFNLLGGGTIDISNLFGGLAVTDHGEYLWVTDPDSNRAFRIKGPLTANPVVDIVIGQQNNTTTDCNQGSSTNPPALNTLCKPGTLKFDKYGNLYLSDHFFEISGNVRMLMYDPSLFPANPSSEVYNISATKEFPAVGTHGNSTDAFATWEPAFDSSNRMIVGGNPYQGMRWVLYYDNPQNYNPSDPSDPSYAHNSGVLKDFYGWAFAATFDAYDNLYVYDVNRGKILIYKTPFLDAPTLTELTPVSSPNISATPTYTFNTTAEGTLTYGGGCTSSTTNATIGNNTITFNQLNDGTYSSCTITLTSPASAQSNVLQIQTFTIIARSSMLKTKGDFNASGRVDLSDLSILASFWNQTSTTGDANQDGNVNLSDLSILASHWLSYF